MSATATTQRSDSPEVLAARYDAVRRATLALREPLSDEDCVVQSMPDASPVKWHLAHTSWFFETFVLEPALPAYEPFAPEYRVLFNSYYNSVGEQHARPERGMLSRPSLDEVLAYRAWVDERMAKLLGQSDALSTELSEIVELGLHHEQQHQELILTDLKHMLSRNPLHPAYLAEDARGVASDGDAAEPLQWQAYPGGESWLGHAGDGFHFDNEGPRHRVWLEPFELASRPVTNGEFLEFMQAGGYRQAELWLSDGWSLLGEREWEAPLYWQRRGGVWHSFGLNGLQPVRAADPVCHVSYYEAEAYASWRGARLASEAEWECAAEPEPVAGNFVESGRLEPEPSPQRQGAPSALFGDVWEWTRSAYAAYPRYRAAQGALGEYNGKFMCNQLVLRGGSCASPRSHLRASYRNFFPADARWQFSGIRLARDTS